MRLTVISAEYAESQEGLNHTGLATLSWLAATKSLRSWSCKADGLTADS